MEPSSWNALGLAAITAAGAMFGAWVKRKADKDRLEFDAKMAALQASNEACEEKHAEIEERHAEVERKLEACEERHTETDARITALEDKAQ